MDSSNNDSLGVSVATDAAKSYLIITNISKRNNVRALLQVAVAFGCTKILIVGQKSFQFTIVNDDGNDDDESQSHVTSTDVPKHLIPIFASGVITIERFDKWQSCVSYLKEHSITLVGVEIHEGAKTIREICHFLDSKNDGHNDVAFLMGNEGTGLQEKQMLSCDMFCRIPQYGCGTASLNVYVAASIVLYTFHMYQRQQQLEYARRSLPTDTNINLNRHE